MRSGNRRPEPERPYSPPCRLGDQRASTPPTRAKPQQTAPKVLEPPSRLLLEPRLKTCRRGAPLSVERRRAATSSQEGPCQKPQRGPGSGNAASQRNFRRFDGPFSDGVSTGFAASKAFWQRRHRAVSRGAKSRTPSHTGSRFGLDPGEETGPYSFLPKWLPSSVPSTPKPASTGPCTGRMRSSTTRAKVSTHPDFCHPPSGRFVRTTFKRTFGRLHRPGCKGSETAPLNGQKVPEIRLACSALGRREIHKRTSKNSASKNHPEGPSRLRRTAGSLAGPQKGKTRRIRRAPSTEGAVFETPRGQMGVVVQLAHWGSQL
mmetsp:Transcript_29768/g.102518  ORF Transcript_29768/g.102518 Transcript_29768/m.102518 type:complete len:318 (-) Transcript_29768:73-1026(-)